MPLYSKYCYMRFPQGKPKALTLSYDDGVEQDEKLIGLMERYRVKGTFNVSYGNVCPEGRVYESGRIHRPMTMKQLRKGYDKDFIELAIHGWHHPWLDELEPSVVHREIYEDRLGWEKEFGIVVRGMAYPYGTYNDQVVKILKQMGIRYARTIQKTEQFDLPKDWLRWHPTCHHKHPHLMELADEFLSMKVRKDSKLFYLWGHSYEFEEKDNWDVIESFFQKMADHEDIWYATNIEIYDYIKAFEALQYSAKGDCVMNSSAIDVWLEYEGKIFCVPAGDMIDLK